MRRDRTLQMQKSGRQITGIDTTGVVVPLPKTPGLKQIAVYAQTTRIHWRTGDALLVGTDVQTYTQTTTAADPTLAINVWDYIPISDTDTHIAFRTASGSAALHMFLLLDAPVDYYTDVVAPLGDVVAHWSGVASESMIDRVGTYPAYIEGTTTISDTLVKGGANSVGFDGTTGKATVAVLDGDFALGRTWDLGFSGWCDVDRVANSNNLHPIAGNSIYINELGLTLYIEDRDSASQKQALRVYFSRGNGVTTAIVGSGQFLVVPDGSPHHVALSCDGVNATVYYDGVPAAYGTVPTVVAADSEFGFTLGYMDSSVATEFFADLDIGDATLFSAAKTDANVLALYEGGGGPEHYYKQLIDQGAIHVWPLESNSLDIITKTTGTESGDTQSNIRPLGRRMGQTTEFTGAGSYAIANGDIDLSMGSSDSWTILAMGRVDSTISPVANIGLFGFGTASGQSHAAIFTIGTAVTGRIIDDSSTSISGGDLSISVPTIKTDEKWRMFALVMDRGTDTAYLYVVSDSGTLSDSASAASVGDLLPTGTFQIANCLTTTGWEGQMAGAAVFQRALSQAEVESLYAYANASGFVFGIPMYSAPLAMYDSRVVHQSGGNTTSWPDASGVRSTATVLDGTPGYSATGGPGGGPAVTFGGAASFDAGATPILPANANPWVMYILASSTSAASYILAQITLLSGNGRAGVGFNSGGAGYNAFFGNDADDPSLPIDIGGNTADWYVITLAIHPTETITGVDETEAVDVVVPNSIQQTGVLLGAVTNSSVTYNGGTRTNFYSGSIAHLSVWEGEHNEEQRASVRAFIRKQHGV